MLAPAGTSGGRKGMRWVTGRGSQERGAARSRGEADQKDSEADRRSKEAFLSTGEEDLREGEQRNSRNGR